MKFGWLTLALAPSPEEDYAGIEQQLAQACYAEEVGFDDVWLTEHYFTGESVYNDPITFGAALAMRTSRGRIGFAVIQMALHHPVRLAVQLALLDNLCQGRLNVVHVQNLTVDMNLLDLVVVTVRPERAVEVNTVV